MSSSEFLGFLGVPRRGETPRNSEEPEELHRVHSSRGHREGADLLSPVRKAILDRWFPRATPVAKPRPDPKAVPRLRRYAGKYRGNIWCHTCPFDPARVFDIDVAVNPDGSLQAMKERWYEVEPRFFRSADGTKRIGFAEDANGKITALTAGSWLVYERLP